jgi:hypothetical protein
MEVRHLLDHVTATDRGAERSPATFRLSALALPLGLLPLVVAWSSGAYGRPPEGVSGEALGAHWVCGWAVPLGVAAVLGYGTAGSPVDRRIVVGGPLDPRTRWWRDHAAVLAGVVLIGVLQVVAQSSMSGEPAPALLVPCLVGMGVAVTFAHVAVARWGLVPGTAAGLATTATCAVVVLPSWLGGPVRMLSIDGTAHNWMLGVAERAAPVSTGALIWTIAAAGTVALARWLPRDISGIGWAAREGWAGD